MAFYKMWLSKNETCTGSIHLEHFLHYSLLPSVGIVMILSCLERRARKSPMDEKWPLLNRRFGVVIPMDFAGAFSNRWSLAFAFGATANKVMILFSEGYFLLQVVPQWARAIAVLIGALEIGLSSYPHFACLSTRSRIVGATLGFLYTATWFVVMFLHITMCPHGQNVGVYENIIFYWPSLLCQLFLLGRFAHTFVKVSWFQFQAAYRDVLSRKTCCIQSLLGLISSPCLPSPPCLQDYQSSIANTALFSISRASRMPAACSALHLHLPGEASSHLIIGAASSHFFPRILEETSFLEVHQAQYVQQLMRKPPLQQPEKSWIQRKVYEWDPYFQFPSRMISMALLAIICLYMFVVMEHYVYMQVSHVLETLELDFEALTASRNSSSNASEVVSSVQHLKEFIATTEGVWIFTTFTACLTCISYVFHILACYRKHMKRLWAGQKEFLPLVFRKLSSSQSVASIARYSGWQIAYILWGYLIIHTVQCLLGVMLMYSFVLPIMNGQGIKMAKSWGMVILTLGIVVGLMLLQIATASIFFLQPKILLNDKEKPLALDNRKVFHNFNYFLFFYNVMLGLGACLFRLLCSATVGAWLVARIDRTIMPKGYEAADMGFRTWIGMLFMDHYHTNPTIICFCHILLTKTRGRQQQRGTSYCHFNNLTDFRVSNKARTRWLLLYTLLNNPSLSALRKPK